MAGTFLIFSCQSTGDWAKKIEWTQIDREHLPVAEDYPDHGAVILLDEGSLEIIGDSELSSTLFKRHRVVKILNPKGYYLANVAVPFSANNRVENLRARTISPEGRITIIREENIYSVTLYPQFIFYADQQAKIFTFPAIEPGCIIEYEYDLSIDNHTLVHNWSFQDEVPVLRSQFQIYVPSEWDLKYRVYNGTVEPEIIEAPSSFKSRYLWKMRDLPPLESEFAMPPFREVELRLAFSPMGFTNWMDVAAWYRTLSESQIKANEGIPELVRGLIETGMSEQEKVQVLFEWVRDHIRYIAVTIGMGSYQPHPAEEILKNRYGDCKDMATLLCAMGNSAGIPMHIALVSTRPNGEVDTSLASPFQFNHAIALCEIDSVSYWLDATRKGAAFDDIPWYNQGTWSLVITDENETRIQKIPGDKHDPNVTQTVWHLTFNNKMQASGKGSSRFSGTLAEDLREFFFYSNHSDAQKWVQLFITNKCSSARLDSFNIINLKPGADPLSIDYAFNVSEILFRDGRNYFLVPAQLFEMSLLHYFYNERRIFPVAFNHGFSNRFELHASLPDGWKTISAVRSDSIVTKFGEAFWMFRPNEDGFSVVMEFRITTESIPADEYEIFRSFLKKVFSMDLNLIQIGKAEVPFPE